MGEDQADEGERAAKADGAGPADLVIPEAAGGLGRVHGPDEFVRKHDPAAGFGDAMAEFVVVGVHVGDGFEAANFGDPAFGRRDGGAERERNSFHPFGNEDAGEEIAGGADGFEFGGEIFLRDAAVERSYAADFWIGEWRYDFTQIIW